MRQETLTPHELRGMLEKTLAGKLADRELTESEYNRLADVILRIRASQRVLEGISNSEGSEGIRAVHADRIAAAFNEIQEITGLAPAQMGDVLAAPEGTETPNPDTNTDRVP